jgi:heme iron utilization protein
MTKDAVPGRQARSLVERERSGVLSTAHAELSGWPFGSVVPYAVLPDGDPVVLLSDIAEHTKNLAREPRASLFVADPVAREAPQSGARVTLLVRARRPDGREGAAAAETYFARFPDAREMLSAHGFAAHVLEVERVRWIAGFGSMGWLSRPQWSGGPAADPVAAHADAICRHMNADHPGALVELASHFGGVEARSARMTGLDREGLDVEVEGDLGQPARSVRVPFPAPVSSPDEVRRTVISMLGRARKRSER